MRTTYILFLIIFPSYLFSQSDYPAFGKADKNELLLKECPFEKGANAMKLFDYQETEIKIDYDVKIEIDRRIRIKIFNKEGSHAANVTIPYIKRNRTSKITDISAYIYNLDSTGNIITEKIEKKDILRNRSEDGISKVVFTFPNVKDGSVIEYRFTHSEKNVMHLDPWFFQDALPTATSICKLTYPEHLKLDFRFISLDTVPNKYSENWAKTTYTFTLNNIPSFKFEAMMSSVRDNLQRVEFGFQPRTSIRNLVTDKIPWSYHNYNLSSSPFFGQQIVTLIPGTEAVIDSARRLLTTDDKINFIYQYVKKNLSWDQNQSFYTDGLSDAWKLKIGNSADINLTILNLLKKSGVNGYPILVSTRSNGKTDPDFISLGQFNGVDVLILDSTTFYVLDGTQKFISYKTIPYNILNRDVLLIDPFEYKWINITTDRPLMKTSIAVKAEVNPNAQLKGEANISFYDHTRAATLEDQNKKKTEEEKEQEDKEFIQKEFEALMIDSLTEENAGDELLPLVQKFQFTYKLLATGDYFILDPFFLSSFRKNPFSDSIRHTDIDMGSNQSYTMYLHLKISDEFDIDELPKNILVRSIDSSMLFKREIFREGNTIVFRNSFDIQRPIYSKEEYFGIKEYFKRIYEVINDRIVLKKKK
jgi:hypothetical protein